MVVQQQGLSADMSQTSMPCIGALLRCYIRVVTSEFLRLVYLAAADNTGAETPRFELLGAEVVRLGTRLRCREMLVRILLLICPVKA